MVEETVVEEPVVDYAMLVEEPAEAPTEAAIEVVAEEPPAEAAVEAVREPESVDKDEYKAYFHDMNAILLPLYKKLNSQADKIYALENQMKSLEAKFDGLRMLVDSILMQSVPQSYRPGTSNSDINTFAPEYLRQSQQYKTQQTKAIQPININWDAISNSCGESPKLIPTTHY